MRSLLKKVLPFNVADQKAEDISQYYVEINAYLKKRYTHRLNQKLAKRQPVNLRRLPFDYTASGDSDAIYVKFEGDEIKEELKQVFRETNERLLVVGAPGAGKTTILLQLVLNLLDTEPFALPVLLNLATWTKEYATLDSWLLKILPTELGVNKTLATKILQDDKLILLFDGLDEVKEEDRKSCLEAIGKYGMDAQRRFVISSRIEEYIQAKKDAPVYGQIEVGQLTSEQITAELKNTKFSQPEAPRMLDALKKDELLKKVMQTPFYFNTLQLLFSSGKVLEDLQFKSDNIEGQEQEIVELFVTENLTLPSQQATTPDEARRWLAFWASRMNRENLVVFELSIG